jgi:hypothetical protein
MKKAREALGKNRKMERAASSAALTPLPSLLLIGVHRRFKLLLFLPWCLGG